MAHFLDGRAPGPASSPVFAVWVTGGAGRSGAGRVRGPSWLTGTPLPCDRSMSIVADGRLGVCDGTHRAFVMKKGVVRLREVEQQDDQL